MGMQDYAEALQDASQAIRLDSSLFEAHFVRAAAYQATRRVRDALDDLNEAIRLRPESGEAYALRSVVRRNLGDVDGAKSDADKARELQATPPKWYMRTLDPATGAVVPQN
jgi:tetratricopeptide (TPR) repeat protein